MLKIASMIKKASFDAAGLELPKEWDIKYLEMPMTQEELARACNGCDILYANSISDVSETVIRANPQLKLIQTEGVAFNKVDTNAAKELGITVCNNRSVNSRSVAEYTIGQMLAGLRRTTECNNQVYELGYANAQSLQRKKGCHELAGSHVGILGFGATGREVAKRLLGWSCHVSYNDVCRFDEETEKEFNVNYLSKEELIEQCDIISIHVPVLPETIGMFNREVFEKMKETAILINAARGEIINQDDLVWALNEGQIAVALIDVIYPEPAPDDLPLLNLKGEAKDRLVITPHIAGTSQEAFHRMSRWSYANFCLIEKGEKPNNIVNGE